MLEIVAKENATIDVIEGSFPLGARNTVKIDIEDDVIKQYIKAIGTNTCLIENNLYQYGNFDYPEDIEGNVELSLNKDSSVKVVDGYGVNYSRCLQCISSDDGLGICRFIPTSNTKIGKKYKLSCQINALEETNASVSINGTETIEVKADANWNTVVTEFDAVSEDFYFGISISGKGTLYLDNLMLFEVENEIIDNIYDNIEFEISVVNPIQDTIINEVINYSKADEENVTILMYLPPITVVDFQDNLLCKLKINLYQEQKEKYLGNSEYNKFKNCVYISEPFILTGYIMPEGYRYELVVGKV